VSLGSRWKPALLWSSVAVAIIIGLQVYVDHSRGVSLRGSLGEAQMWLTFWPIFFFAIWGLTSWRELYGKSFEMGTNAATRAAAATGVGTRGAPCPKCGFASPVTAIHCVRCGGRLREVEVVHVLETLPGARDSVTSILYVLAFVGAFVTGGITIVLMEVVKKEWLENDLLMLSGFLVGATAGLLLFGWLIRRRVRGQAGRRT
jgi:hypothetical protein